MREKKKLAGGNKYVRSELNALWEAIEKKSVLMPLQGWAETSAGLIPPTAAGGDKSVPQFFPTETASGTSQLLSMNPGYVHVPVHQEIDEQLESCQYFAYMPDVHVPPSTTTAMDDEPRPTLTLTNSNTWIIAIDTTFEERNQRIGDIDVGGNKGLDVTMTTAELDADNSIPLDVDPHAHHPAMAYLEAKNYSFNASSVNPRIQAYTEAAFYALVTTSVLRYRPIGRYVIAADGSITDKDWYVEGHIDIQPHPNHRGSSSDTEPTTPTITGFTTGNFPLPS